MFFAVLSTVTTALFEAFPFVGILFRVIVYLLFGGELS